MTTKQKIREVRNCQHDITYLCERLNANIEQADERRYKNLLFKILVKYQGKLTEWK